MTINNNNPIETLISIKNKIPFFSKLSTSDIKSLIEDIKIISFKKDKTIFNEGDSNSKFICYLLDGVLDVYKKDKENQVLIHTIKEPTLFGELLRLTGQPRNASIKSASDNTLVLAFTIKAFENKNIEAKFYRNILKELTKKLTNINESVKNECVQNNITCNQNLIIINPNDLYQSLFHIQKELLLLEDFTYDNICDMFKDIQYISYPKNHIVFKEGGTNSRYIFILLSGAIEFIKIHNTKETIITTVSEPSLFGEFHILTGKPRDATARVLLDETKILALQIKEFEYKNLESRFYNNVILELTNKIENMNEYFNKY